MPPYNIDAAELRRQLAREAERSKEMLAIERFKEKVDEMLAARLAHEKA